MSIQVTLFDIGDHIPSNPKTNRRGAVTRTSGGLGHLATLKNALGGSLAGWTYRGECTDLGRCCGRCSCGQSGLRYQFTIRNGAKSAKVGSVCINMFAESNPELVDSINADRQRMELTKDHTLR